MRLLLDTRTVLWAVGDDARLGPSGRAALLAAENTALLSAVTVWEIAIMRGLGKLRAPDDLEGGLIAAGVQPLSISFPHVRAVEHLPAHHRDPFDRLLIAQALLEDATIVTNDPLIARYDVPVLW